jgi:hypothetical protein
MTAGLEEAIQGGFALLHIRQKAVRHIRQRHVARMSSVNRLRHGNVSYGSKRCEPKPHFHVAAVGQFRPVTTKSFLEVCSDNRRGSGNQISSSTASHKLRPGKNSFGVHTFDIVREFSPTPFIQFYGIAKREAYFRVAVQKCDGALEGTRQQVIVCGQQQQVIGCSPVDSFVIGCDVPFIRCMSEEHHSRVVLR